MRSNFSICGDCDNLACSHADIPCGIHCPECDWFICGNCILSHIEECWLTSAVEIINTPGATEFHFGQEEETKLDPRIKVYSNDQGITKIIIARKKDDTADSKNPKA